jgi:lipoprotein-releasing system ATP-binding protein
MTERLRKLVFSDITKSYDGPEGPVPILRGISLEVSPSESLAIVGPSGSGKSTLLNIIGSLDRPSSGSVRLGDVDITALDGKQLAAFRAKDVGFVFQEHHLLPQLTAFENVLLPTIPAGTAREASNRAGDLLERLGIAHRAGAFPCQMSGGERQRVAVARALINGARLLLCDEPTGSLDPTTGSGMISLLLELAEQQGVTLIVVTHNADHAARFDRCLQLLDGRLSPLNDHAAGENP